MNHRAQQCTNILWSDFLGIGIALTLDDSEGTRGGLDFDVDSFITRYGSEVSLEPYGLEDAPDEFFELERVYFLKTEADKKGRQRIVSCIHDSRNLFAKR